MAGAAILLLIIFVTIVLFSMIDGSTLSMATQTSTLALRVPLDLYDAVKFEQLVTYSAPDSQAISTVARKQDADFFVFANVPPGTSISVDNSAGDFTGADIISFVDNMATAKQAVRITDTIVYRVVAR
jgi:hypothetical protein